MSKNLADDFNDDFEEDNGQVTTLDKPETKTESEYKATSQAIADTLPPEVRAKEVQLNRVEVKPLDKSKWHNKKGKESFQRPHVVEALYDNNTGRYATGLTAEEAKIYGDKMGVSLDDTFNANEPHPFYSLKVAWVILENKTMIFDTRRDIDFVKVKLMKASKYVANSYAEWEKGMWPEATHFIVDEAEEMRGKATKMQVKQEAYVLAQKMSADAKIAIIQIISNKNLKGRSNDMIDTELGDILEGTDDKRDAAEFLRVAKMGKEEVTLRAQVLEALDKHILTKEAGAIYYMGEMLAYDYEAAISYFKNPNNQLMKIQIFEKLIKR